MEVIALAPKRVRRSRSKTAADGLENYVRGVSRFTGIPPETVADSTAAKNYAAATIKRRIQRRRDSGSR